MVSVLVTLLFQLLLAPLVSTSHHYGSSMTFSYKGTNADGSMKVDIRRRSTFDGCYYKQRPYCSKGNCGQVTQVENRIIDQSTSAPRYNNKWCETEESSVWVVRDDTPFEMRADSCCWIRTRNGATSWSWNSFINLGRRSDTGQPNNSPTIAILPFLRVPQNCPRTYKLISFDPDGDRVRCRYGNSNSSECSSCNQPSGFYLDQDSCTIQYQYTSADPRVYAFEMVVEDFSKKHMDLIYKDRTRSHRHPMTDRRRKRAAPWSTQIPGSTPWMWWPTHGLHTTQESLTPTQAPATTQTDTSSYTQTDTSSNTQTDTGSYTPTDKISYTQTGTSSNTQTDKTSYTQTSKISYTQTDKTSYTQKSPYTQTEKTPYTQRDKTSYNQTGTSSYPQTDTSSYPQTDTSSYPQTDTSSYPQTDTSSYPQTDTSSYPQTDKTSYTTPPMNPTLWWLYSTTPRPMSRITQLYTATKSPWWIHNGQTTTHRTPQWASWQTPPTTTRNYYKTTPRQNTVFSHLSKLPLQFSLLVDPPAPSCHEGHYIPKFVHPTPKNGAVIMGEPDKIVEIRVKAQAAYTSIYDIIISGPMNITKRKTTHNEFVISWKPIADDLGQHYAVCFAVEAFSWTSTTVDPTTPYYFTHHHHHDKISSQSGMYQSEMRCVLLQIVESQIKANVICKESSMQVEVNKSSLVGLEADHLRLNDPLNTACSLTTHSNSTHIIGVVPLNACGTLIEEDDDNLIFKNEITTVDDTTDLITRKHLLELQFYCQYPKSGNVTLSFIGHRKKTVVWERGFGTFTYQFEFYPDDDYRTMIDPNSYPLEYELGSRIYMQIEAQTSVNDTEIFVESCRAAPYDNPSYRPTYSIIENGCKVDPTVLIYNSDDKKHFQFSIEAFGFIGLLDQVYISCSVVICEAGNQNTRCSRGCMNATRNNTHDSHHRHRRDAVIQSMNHFVSQGPLRLKRSTPGRVSSGGLNMNLTLVFICGCALAVVGMICGLMIYKIKTSSTKYQRFPDTES